MTPVELENHLHKLNLEPRARSEILEMAASSPARKVGDGALNNSIVFFQSNKNDDTRVLESHTVERLCALELELNPDVLGYYSQVRCVGIERRNGAHISSGTVDFMAICRHAIRLIECKAGTSIAKLVASSPDEWQLLDGHVIRPPYVSWAEKRGASFEVWSSPTRVAPYLANLQLVYALTSVFGQVDLGPIAQQAIQCVRQSPKTIQAVCSAVDRFSPEIAAFLIGTGHLFGAIKHVLIGDSDRFTLYADRDQAAHAEQIYGDRVHGSLSQSMDPLARASLTDVNRAKDRLRYVDALIASGDVPDRYWKPLVTAVKTARASGQNDLAVCLTRYSASGNRLSRLLDAQVEILESIRVSHWNSGLSHDLSDLHVALRGACDERGVRTPTKKTLNRFINKTPQTTRLLATAGIRAYQANRPASDPRLRSMPAQARHLVLEIDSTKCDNRSMPDVASVLVLEAPNLYVGVDGCTNEPMAHSFVFGPARTDGLALLLREYVRRHGRLPHEIRVDRGTENKSKWLKAFCKRYGIHLVILPTGGSRYKGGIENLLGRVNSQVSHRLVGSTRPDQAGRSVDGKFKSYRTARHQFSTIREAIETALFHDFVLVPDGDGESPEQRKIDSKEQFPSVGRLQPFDEEFLWQTSVPAKAKEFNPLKGIRTFGQTFCSRELLDSWNASCIDQVRRDPSDPSLVRVQHARGNVRAWSKFTARISHADQSDQEFHSLFSAQIRGESRERREDLHRARHYRTTAANAAVSSGSPAIDGDSPQAPLPAKTASKADRPQLKFSIAFDDIADLSESA